ncbi:MAG: undecaprenyl/decaprenyl-phosphate alpha-N-acetylglucosaminyl 1-phosphate transferase [Candidatus Glassbacteria bacterium]|nr:undecaprenyl/decaprenyl-phosphate alpha-N-acetylglucosaminyl 1-phosphate transferase [Candidatus Glassbacteria bacterium]
MEINLETVKQALAVLIGSSVLSYVLIVFFKHLALKAQVVDRPRQDRFHQQAVPLMGGNAIYFAFLTGLVVKGLISPVVGLVMLVGVAAVLYGIFRHRDRLMLIFIISAAWCSVLGILLAGNSDNQLLGLLLGGTILLLVGNVDDACGGVIPHVKLIGQVIAGFFLIYFGINVHFFIDVGTQWQYEWLRNLSYPFTLFWIIGMTNAFNLIDNMNGLSCGVAVISSFFFGLISFVNGHQELGYIFFVFLGAGLGYLPHNFPGAKIFMGDAGSLFIGFVIASLSIVGSWSTPEGWATDRLKISLTIPILVLIYPIFDTALVTITRMLRGRPISLGGKDHSSHRLVKLGLRPVDAVLLIYSFCALAGFCGLFLTVIYYEQAILILAFTVLFILLFGLRLARIDIQNHNGG